VQGIYSGYECMMNICGVQIDDEGDFYFMGFIMLQYSHSKTTSYKNVPQSYTTLNVRIISGDSFPACTTAEQNKF